MWILHYFDIMDIQQEFSYDPDTLQLLLNKCYHSHILFNCTIYNSARHLYITYFNFVGKILLVVFFGGLIDFSMTQRLLN